MNTTETYIDFDDYAVRHGAAPLWGDPSLHRSSEHMSKGQWQRLVEHQKQKDLALLAKRQRLYAEYVRRLSAGEIAQMSTQERLEMVATNQPLSERGQAAQRALAKRAARMGAKP